MLCFRIPTGSGQSLLLTLTQILDGNLSSCSQLVSAKQNLDVKKVTNIYYCLGNSHF